ncbi:hypothetical protein CHRYSEO8AT_30004 [Chryseobacterium sp. 8AT]|nr:hypothetical protein CHRYSEO8AT_30004 [Chryseobacterium sp. 8AT]
MIPQPNNLLFSTAQYGVSGNLVVKDFALFELNIKMGWSITSTHFFFAENLDDRISKMIMLF